MGFLCKKRDENKEKSKEIDRKIEAWNRPFKNAIKMLLLGTGESGKTTILKQMKILHIKGFSKEERIEKITQIKRNVHEASIELAKHLEPLGFQPEMKTQEIVQKLIELDSNNSMPEFNDEYFDMITDFWKDSATKGCLKRSNEFQLIDSAEYFLNKLDELRQINYLPGDDDILHCRQMTTGIQKIEFTVKIPKSMQGGTQEFWMFDVGGQRGERKKWIRVFEGIQAVLFIIAVSDFDQKLREDQTQNRLRESISLFEDVWKSSFLVEAGLIVFLNKQDVLEHKIKEGRNIAEYFPDYNNFKATHLNLPKDEYLKAKKFIRKLMIDVTQKRDSTNKGKNYKGININNIHTRECYYHDTIATNTENIRLVFNDVHHVILKNVLKDMGLL